MIYEVTQTPNIHAGSSKNINKNINRKESINILFFKQIQILCIILCPFYYANVDVFSWIYYLRVFRNRQFGVEVIIIFYASANRQSTKLQWISCESFISKISNFYTENTLYHIFFSFVLTFFLSYFSTRKKITIIVGAKYNMYRYLYN